MSATLSIEQSNRFAGWAPSVEQEVSEEIEWSGRKKMICMLILGATSWGIFAAPLLLLF